MKATINVKGKTFDGEFLGYGKVWTFKSDDPYFREHYENGKLASFSQYVDESWVTQERIDIFNAIDAKNNDLTLNGLSTTG